MQLCCFPNISLFRKVLLCLAAKVALQLVHKVSYISTSVILVVNGTCRKTFGKILKYHA